MDAILRIMYINKIEDYDLSQTSKTIKVGNCTVYNQGGWRYNNGEGSCSLNIGDTLLIDKEQRIACVVLPKIKGPAFLAQLKKEVTFGRKEGNDVVLAEKIVSGSHCCIMQKTDGWYIKDSSTNGTYVNDKRVVEAKLKAGDIIKIGSYSVKFGLHLEFLAVDEKIKIELPLWKPKAKDIFKPKPYPWFSPSPRMLKPLKPLTVEIQSAPEIGSKPQMGMGMIALDPTMMALSLGSQALRYGLGKKKYSKQEKQRAEVYANYLTQIEDQIQKYEKEQKTYALKTHPSLADCIKRVEGPSANLWERHVGDSDFLSLRLATGTVPSKISIRTPQQRLQLEEEELDKVPEKLAEKYEFIKDMPVCHSFIEGGNLGIVSSRIGRIDQLVNNLVIQMATLHSPKDVKMVFVGVNANNAWAKWLPHTFSDDRTNRFMINDKDSLEPLEKIVEERMKGQEQWSFGKRNSNVPHYVFIVSSPELLNGTACGKALMMNNQELGISGIFYALNQGELPHSVRSVAELVGTVGSLEKIILRVDGEEIEAKYSAKDALDADSLDSFARKMAPIRLQGMETTNLGLPSVVSLFDGLGINAITNFKEIWEKATPEESLAVPIGLMENGEPFYFDIHEKHHGPHGMVAGTAGSGKSQLAQTWIASMALHFSPDDVNFILVDFKGDSLLQPFVNMPHLAGSISNLDKDVARSFSAMESELERRQRLLSDYGCNDIIKYLKKRRQNPDMPKMPYLILVIDEFAEFKSQFPGFTKALDHLYRGGRSLGFFVMLMTQAPSGIVTEQMRANAHFRWCLQVKNSGDSRELLGTNDATAIRVPGRAYIKSGDTYELIQGFFGGVQVHAENKTEQQKLLPVSVIELDGSKLEYNSMVKKNKFNETTQLDALMNQLQLYCERAGIEKAASVWQPELPEKVELLDSQSWSANHCWQYNLYHPVSSPVAKLGLVDDPSNQSQYFLEHNFWKDGSFAVYGMPMSGKTVFLQSMIVSLCSKYEPKDVHIYAIEIGGYGLRALETFPHVGAAAGDDEQENIDKILKLLLEELDDRKKKFRKFGAGSPEMFVKTSSLELPTVILAIDNLNGAGIQAVDLNNAVMKLAREGGAFGIYVAASFNGTTGVSYQLVQNIKTSYALELSDKSDYNTIVGRPDETIPKGVVGRGLVRANSKPLLFQTAIPFMNVDDGTRISWLRDMAEKMQSATHMGPKGIVNVGEVIPYGSVEGEPLVLGLDSKTGEAVKLPLEENVSILVSDASGQKYDIVKSFDQQLRRIVGAKVYYAYDCVSGNDYITPSDVESKHMPAALKNIGMLDKQIPYIADELRKRQAELAETPGKRFKPLIIILYDYLKIISGCQTETLQRLEVFVRLGKSLGLTVIGFDTAESMTKAKFRGDILTETMREGARVLIGGKMIDHQIGADVMYDLQMTHNGNVKDNEAVFIKDNNIISYRRMQGE